MAGEQFKHRSSGQNKLMWSMLRDISNQVIWHGQQMSPEDWKWVFSAAIRRQKMVPGIDGGMVLIGFPTSAMSTEELSDMIEMMGAFGSERGVDWKDQNG